MQLRENVALGLDIGNASLGWALIEENPETLEKQLLTRPGSAGQVEYALGARLFDAPENDKTKEPLSVHRRQMRSQRRVIQRRARRMQKLRALLAAHGVSSALDIENFHLPRGRRQADPWQLRKEGLSRLLSPEELAAVLLHICKHRGFRSNSKRDKAAGSDNDTGKMLKGVAELERLTRESGLTVGALLADADPQLNPALRRRNYCDLKGEPVYAHTMLRSLQEEETDKLFACQQAFGSSVATDELREKFKDIAFSQRPLASVENLVGNCPFLPAEKRAPRFAPTAERFRLAQRLAILRLSGLKNEVYALDTEQIEKILLLQGRQEKLTYKTLRKTLHLPEGDRFEGLSYGKDKKDPEAADIVSRSGAAMPGSHVFSNCWEKRAFSVCLSCAPGLTTNSPACAASTASANWCRTMTTSA